MATLLATLLVCLLTLLALLAGALAETGRTARTPAQIAAAALATTPRRHLGWLAAIIVAAPLLTAVVATRAALWLALAALAWVACRITTALAMDGRRVRVARTAGARI
ncbi:hypothetical protein OIE66_30710 [Nonomuraea sp. NBC_01738]|uniref:hypothetical protein n=1 Tax=Nonomuraea sp. NBC_01738 TaxID=2976003 RepID=UPI002E14FB6A|nr:hypothetical protein OIE66_30710 [Nonomuraea sp. NBC_01738]